MEQQATRRKKQAAAVLSIISNSILIVIKLAAGLFTGSIALLSEAIHSFLDLGASTIAWVAVSRSGKPADAEHPYGHGKIENLTAAIEGLLILLGAGFIIFEALRRLEAPELLEHPEIGIVVMGISIVVNLVVSKRLRDVARETNSPALEGDAAHLHADIFTSVGVLLGFIVALFTDVAWLDPAIALALCGVIIWSGTRLMYHASKALVDESLPDEEHQQVEHVVASFADRGVRGFHKIRSRMAGSQRLVDLHVQFTDTMTLREAHSLAHEIQHRIQAELHETDVLIHLEPEEIRTTDKEHPSNRG